MKAHELSRNLPAMFTVGITHGTAHLLVVATGTARLCDVCGLVDLVSTVARMCGDRKVVLDLLAVRPELSFTEHLRLGEHTAHALSDIEKVAAVVDPREYRAISERSAQKHGLNLKAFTSLVEAEAWLAS
ncbi:hypothetical protein EZ313_05100 [Ramlibacter henchirensis]|uniref:STAS/SEC14 domain-containing protein n=1 Tax=Ramlibacter henchirensis TaxID=204072 RepID=A0A4Z0C6M8_9BURK|nr:hypothetical protein [Ramlibacter henchirensis]TFZ06028.1 hypothetical protein EZ313_05100 [Ramlibacter henchirensis]